MEELVNKYGMLNFGCIDFTTFMTIVAEVDKELGGDMNKDWFESTDSLANADSVISVVDLRHVLSCLGDKIHITKEDINEIIDLAKIKDDGSIDYMGFISRLLKKMD